jgi:hypothetical protein
MKKTFFVYLDNTSDAADNVVRVVKAKSKEEAAAFVDLAGRFTVRQVLTTRECQRTKDGWWKLLRANKGEIQ